MNKAFADVASTVTSASVVGRTMFTDACREEHMPLAAADSILHLYPPEQHIDRLAKYLTAPALEVVALNAREPELRELAQAALVTQQMTKR